MGYERALPDGEVLASFGEDLWSKEDRDRQERLVEQQLEGAGYWNLISPDGTLNLEDRKKWSGIVNHILLEYNLSLVIAKRLKDVGERDNISELKEINLTDIANASLISDIAKGKSDKERLKTGATNEDTHSELGYKMGQQIGLPDHVSRVALTHHFPTEEEQIPTWLDKIVFLAEYFTSQKYMTMDERMNDIEDRWITKRLEKGLPPLIDPERFKKTRVLGQTTKKQVFDLLGITDEQEFLDTIPHLREEKYLRALYERYEESRGAGFSRRQEMRKNEKNSLG